MCKKPRIIAVGANPAWQKVLQFKCLRHNAVNRADSLLAFASGKGVNFARAAKKFAAAEVELLQFAGGDNGRLLLADLEQEALSATSIPVQEPTRCCITCLSQADNSMTELIEPSIAPDTAAQSAALEFLQEKLPEADGLALCGQLPGGMAIDFYVHCAQIAAACGKQLLIDSWKNAEALLPHARQAALKINVEELQMLTGIADVSAAAQSLFSSYELTAAAITDGAGQAYFFAREHAWRYTVPYLAEVVNPVGSGDTASAVFFSAVLSGQEPVEAFAWALAAATANCLSLKCGEFELSKMEEFRSQVIVESIY